MHKEGKIISHIPATPKPQCSSSSMRLEDLPEVQPSTGAGLHWYIYIYNIRKILMIERESFLVHIPLNIGCSLYYKLSICHIHDDFRDKS